MRTRSRMRSEILEESLELLPRAVGQLRPPGRRHFRMPRSGHLRIRTGRRDQTRSPRPLSRRGSPRRFDRLRRDRPRRRTHDPTTTCFLGILPQALSGWLRCSVARSGSILGSAVSINQSRRKPPNVCVSDDGPVSPFDSRRGSGSPKLSPLRSGTSYVAAEPIAPSDRSWPAARVDHTPESNRDSAELDAIA